MELVINTGKKEYNLKDQNGNIIGRIEFNPSDPNFVARMQNFTDRYTELSDKADEIGKSFEAGELGKAGNELIELDNAIKAELDRLFDAEISKIVFGATNCLATVNGVPFVERFLNAVLPEFKAAVNRERKAQEERISKYIGKYRAQKGGKRHNG